MIVRKEILRIFIAFLLSVLPVAGANTVPAPVYEPAEQTAGVSESNDTDAGPPAGKGHSSGTKNTAPKEPQKERKTWKWTNPFRRSRKGTEESTEETVPEPKAADGSAFNWNKPRTYHVVKTTQLRQSPWSGPATAASLPGAEENVTVEESASGAAAGEAAATPGSLDQQVLSVAYSGLNVVRYPAELFMLCIAGETSGLAADVVSGGDHGRAYGACQFDYRFDLVGFMRYAYELHPQLWPAFARYINCKNGDAILQNNEVIGKAFLDAYAVDQENALADQLVYAARRYWDSCASRLNHAGYRLDERSIAVSAAIFSVNVNAGVHTEDYIRVLNTDMTDEEMICAIYQLRNGELARERVFGGRKGTNGRYSTSEPQMALDLLYGYINIHSNVSYGNGVEWHGNIFQ